MKDFSRLFVINDGDSSGWTNSTRTSFVIAVKADVLTVRWKSGRDMFAKEINTAFGRFLKEYEAEYGDKVPTYERRCRYRFCFRQGSSGCQDTYIEIDKGDGFPERKFLMHQSCYDKCPAFRCFVYDFLDLCIAGGFLKAEGGFYTYPEADDGNADCEMQVIKPRMTQYEEGWTQPWRESDGVVPLIVVREEPKAEEDDSDD